MSPLSPTTNQPHSHPPGLAISFGIKSTLGALRKMCLRFQFIPLPPFKSIVTLWFGLKKWAKFTEPVDIPSSSEVFIIADGDQTVPIIHAKLRHF
jgi:hypothetical protein